MCGAKFSDRVDRVSVVVAERQTIPADRPATRVALAGLGVPQSVAMKMTGHKTNSVFRRYDIVSPDDLRIAAERLDAATG